MIAKSIQDAINDQINYELYSSYLYLAMSACFHDQELPGFAHWMEMQSYEELIHVQKFYKYLNDREGRVVLKAITEPPVKWETPLESFQAAYAHELTVTDRLNKLSDLALKEKDHATHMFLQWFVNEQVEEEATVKNVVTSLKLVSKEGQGLFMMNKDLGTRPLPVFTPNAAK